MGKPPRLKILMLGAPLCYEWRDLYTTIYIIMKLDDIFDYLMIPVDTCLSPERVVWLALALDYLEKESRDEDES
jgi:hypothetical protein